MPPTRTLLTVLEVAEWLGLSVTMIHRAIRAGLPSRKFAVAIASPPPMSSAGIA
jgi:hypothetical protein